MAFRNYLNYNYDDFEPKPMANASANVDLPAISNKPQRGYFAHSQHRIPTQDDLSNYYYSADQAYYQQQQYFDRTDLEKYEIGNITNQISQKFSKLYPQNAIEINQIFWKVFLWVALIPLINSACINVYGLAKNIFHHVELKSEFKKLTGEKSEVLGKMKEYHSVSGMKRTIKEEIKAIEENEILVKIL